MVMIRKTAEDRFEFLYQEGPDTRDSPAEGALAGIAYRGRSAAPRDGSRYVDRRHGRVCGEEDDSERDVPEFLDNSEQATGDRFGCNRTGCGRGGRIYVNSYLSL